MTSCDYAGGISFRIESVQDDYSKPIEMGYLMEVVEGELPIGLQQPSKPITTLRNDLRHGIWWQWNDGATDEQEAFDFVVVVYAVDLAGNASAPSEPIRIKHPGGKGKSEPNQLMQTDGQQAGRR